MNDKAYIMTLIANTLVTLGVLAFSAFLCWYFNAARYACWSLMVLYFEIVRSA